MRLLLLVLAAVLFAHSGYARVWTNSEGKKVEADLVEIRENSIIIKPRNSNRTFEYQISRLSEEDRLYILRQKRLQSQPTVPAPRVIAARGEWLESWSLAQSDARRLDYPIILFFTGSDWCDYCVEVEESLLQNPAFLDYAKRRLVLMKVDLKRGPQEISIREQNNLLRARYPTSGFPTLYLVHDEGAVLWKKRRFDGTTVQSLIQEIDAALATP